MTQFEGGQASPPSAGEIESSSFPVANSFIQVHDSLNMKFGVRE